MLVWAWVLSVFLFAAFGVFIADELDKMMYMASVVSIATLFLFFILLWALVDTYGCTVHNKKLLHQLLSHHNHGKM